MTIGIVAALPVEGAAMSALIEDPREVWVDDDPNVYRIGHLASIERGRPHRVVLTTLAQDNTRNAATACTEMLRTFPRIRCVIMTGVAGGVPSPKQPERHVRLGDVVVAVDGVVDYGHVRQQAGPPEPRRPVTGISLDVVRAVGLLREDIILGRSPAWDEVVAPARDQPMAVFARPPVSTDVLHAHGRRLEHPPMRESGHVQGRPKLHFGKLGCADVLMMNEDVRDDLVRRHDILAFEMEAAGVATAAAARGVSWFMVRGIVDYCDGFKNDRWHPYSSLSAAGCVRLLLSYCRPFPVWRLAPRSRVIALLPDHELDRLGDMLREADEVDAIDVWRAALGDLTPLPESPGDLAELASRLAERNAGADGLPPALAFVEEVAARVEPRLGARLRGWLDRMAERLQITDIMQHHRDRAEGRRQHLADGADPQPPVPSALLIQIERDGIDHERCEVRYWIQRRPERWHPEPSDPRHTTFRDIERVLEAAIRHAETLWRATRGPVEVELLLPAELLHRAVEWWHIELESPTPVPLCLDYPVAVRSLDRMRAAYRHRVWSNRWQAMWQPPPAQRAYHGDDRSGSFDLELWNARLRDDTGVTTVILGNPPQHESGQHELQSALNAGIPVVLWDRREASPPDARELLSQIAEGHPADLRQRIRALRREAAQLPPDDRRDHPGRHLALLWDDPDRNVYEGGTPT